MGLRFVIIGGGPAGNTAATHAARLGAEVTLVERDSSAGAAHLCDCIPSKAMIATGGAMSFNRRISGMGLTESTSTIDLDLVEGRGSAEITERLQRGVVELLDSQGVRMIARRRTAEGTARGRRRHRARASRRSTPTPCWSRPAAGPASPTGPRSTGGGSSRRVMRTRRRSCPRTSW